MWEQRIFGMEYCHALPNHSKYLLVCDDDLSFEPDFAEKLIEIAETHKADTLVPIADYRCSRLKNFIGKIFGERTENRTSPYKITIKANGRYTVNNSLKDNVNPTQSGPFQCFLMRTGIVPELCLREECWLDDTRYAWPDDQVFFYKAHLKGLRTLSCKTPTFKHLDGRSGVPSRERQIDSIYSHGRNIVIFWNRFILPNRKNKLAVLQARTSFAYYILMARMRYLILSAKRRDLNVLRTFNKGVSDGRGYLKA